MSETNGNGNGNGRLSWGTIVMIAAVVGGMAAVFRPIQQAQENEHKRIDKVEKWQEDYMRGLIPSSAERELAAQKMQFVEVETQFRGQRDKLDREERDLDRLSGQVGMMREQLAVLRSRNGNLP